MMNFKTSLFLLLAKEETQMAFRDGPLEKLWGVGGGEGNFRAAGFFFRYQIPGMNFFLAHSMNVF